MSNTNQPRIVASNQPRKYGATRSRLTDIMEALKQEQDALIEQLGVFKLQRDDLDQKLAFQLHELQLFTANLNDFSNIHSKIKIQYEDEITRLKQELHVAKATIKSLGGQVPPKRDGLFISNIAPEVTSVNLPKKQKVDVQKPAPTNHESTGECLLTTENSRKQDGNDYHVLYNSAIKPFQDSNMKINLVSSLDHESVVCCVKFSNCGKFIATGCNHFATVYQVDTGAIVAILGNIPTDTDKPQDLYIRSVVFSPDNNYLATGAEDRSIRVWEIATRRIKYTFLGHEQEIYSLDWSRDGSILVSGSGDKCIKVWSMIEGKLLLTMMNSDDKTLTISPTDTRECGVTSVAMNPVFTRCVASVYSNS